MRHLEIPTILLIAIVPIVATGAEPARDRADANQAAIAGALSAAAKALEQGRLDDFLAHFTGNDAEVEVLRAAAELGWAWEDYHDRAISVYGKQACQQAGLPPRDASNRFSPIGCRAPKISVVGTTAVVSGPDSRPFSLAQDKHGRWKLDADQWARRFGQPLLLKNERQVNKLEVAKVFRELAAITRESARQDLILGRSPKEAFQVILYRVVFRNTDFALDNQGTNSQQQRNEGRCGTSSDTPRADGDDDPFAEGASDDDSPVTGDPFSGASGPRPDSHRSYRRFRSDPPELRFSCAVVLDGREETHAQALLNGDSTARLAAARALWRGHSRKYASGVMKYVAELPPGGEQHRTFRQEVEAAFEPQAILRELSDGDYAWGAWLAFLRPHRDVVPVLVRRLDDKPDMLPETMLALGKSGDQRALRPLLGLLGSVDYRTAGDAAKALRYFSGRDVEQKLIEALGANNGWLQVNACQSLAKMGTPRAIAALTKLAEDDRYTGALNVKGMAQDAIEKIEKRENSESPQLDIHR